MSVSDAPRVDAGGEATLDVVVRNAKARSPSVSFEVEVATDESTWSEVHLFDGAPEEICGLATEVALAAVRRAAVTATPRGPG